MSKITTVVTHSARTIDQTEVWTVLAAKVVAAIAWPVFIFAIVWLFREEVRQFLRRVVKVAVGSATVEAAELKADAAINEAEAVAAHSQPSGGPADAGAAEAPKQNRLGEDVGELYTRSGRAWRSPPSFNRSWITIETELREAARRAGMPEPIPYDHHELGAYLMSLARLRPETFDLIDRAAALWRSVSGPQAFPDRQLYYDASVSIASAIHAETSSPGPTAGETETPAPSA